jgi:hypothetical protein
MFCTLDRARPARESDWRATSGSARCGRQDNLSFLLRVSGTRSPESSQERPTRFANDGRWSSPRENQRRCLRPSYVHHRRRSGQLDLNEQRRTHPRPRANVEAPISSQVRASRRCPELRDVDGFRQSRLVLPCEQFRPDWISPCSRKPRRDGHVQGSFLFGIASPRRRRFCHSRIHYDRPPMGNAQERILGTQPLNVPLGSLKRSSPCATPFVGAADVVPAADVSDEELPHNSRTVGETVGVRSST